MKFLTYILLSYLVYQYFIKPVLPKGKKEEIPNIKNKKTEPKPQNNTDEYIDYEEIN